MRRAAVLAVCVLLECAVAAAQSPSGGRPLTHDDYDGWRSLAARVVSRDGTWIALAVRPQLGDGELIVRATAGDAVWRHPRGTAPVFTEDGTHVVFRIEPPRAERRAWERRQLEKKKAKKKGGTKKPGNGADGKDAEDEKPLPALGILDVTTGEVTVIERLKDFRVPEEGPAVVAYRLEKKKEKRAKKAEGEKKAE